MNDDENNESDAGGKETNTSDKDGEKPVSIVEEARAIRDEIKEERIKLTEENDRREKARAEDMLGGNSDAGQQTEVKKETDADYAKRVQSGEFNGPKEA